MKRSPLNRKTPLRPSRSVSKALHPAGKSADFSDEVRDLVRRRAAGKCELSAPKCSGAGTQFHHRQLRRGGDHSALNCILLCPNCHLYVHGHVAESMNAGWLVSQYQKAADVPWKRYGE